MKTNSTGQRESPWQWLLLCNGKGVEFEDTEWSRKKKVTGWKCQDIPNAGDIKSPHSGNDGDECM